MAPSSGDEKKVKRKHEIEVFPCFRSGGSLPVPKPAKVPPGLLPKPKPQLPEPKFAQENTASVNLIKCAEFVPKCEDVLICDIIQEANYLQEVTSTSVHIKELKPPPEPSQPPPPPPVAKPNQGEGCKKHSRCHCNLLSLETPNFFTLSA